MTDKLKKIKLIVTDVDGVLTDGRIYLTETGEIKVFNNKDAPRMAVALRSGIRICFFTARKGEAVARRAKELKVDIIFKQELKEKNVSFADEMKQRFGVSLEEILYIGDDWSDLYAMKQVGVAVTPADGSTENKQIAHITTKAAGGMGVMAETVETLMRAQGTWEKYSTEYRDELIY